MEPLLSICECPVVVKINLWCLKCVRRCVNNSQLLVYLTLRVCVCVSLAGKCCGSYCRTCAGGWRSTALMASDLMASPPCCTTTTASVRLLCVNLFIYEWLARLNHFLILYFETHNAICTTNSRWLKGKASRGFVETPD